MNTNRTNVKELALILQALRSVYVHDVEDIRQKLIKQLEGELAARGLSLAEPN